MNARILQFRAPSERRLKAFFADPSEPPSDVERLAAVMTGGLRSLHRRSPSRALQFAQGTLMLLDRAFADLAAEEGGRA